MNRMFWTAAFAAVGAMSAVGAGASAPEPTARTLAPAVKAFLADHGDVCFAWYAWPRDLTAAEQQSGINEAVQLPVLERLGIVQSVAIAEAISTNPGPASPVRRYTLTSKGRQYYLQKKRTTLNVHSQIEQHDADFCVAHLSLDKVVKWSPPESFNGHPETRVQYSYHIKAADWMSDPQAQKVFPVVDRMIRGQGNLLMSATVQLQDGRWVPVLPGQ